MQSYQSSLFSQDDYNSIPGEHIALPGNDDLDAVDDLTLDQLLNDSKRDEPHAYPEASNYEPDQKRARLNICSTLHEQKLSWGMGSHKIEYGESVEKS